MNIQEAENLLKQAAEYNPPRREKSIFDMGGRGYYENPTTDLLAFFLYPKQDHGLGNVFLRALLNCLSTGAALTADLRQPPQREVRTAKGNRMDLILQGVGWDMLLENKVLSPVDNPIDDYENTFNCRYKNDARKAFYVLLSPLGDIPDKGWTGVERWTGVAYASLIDNVQRQLESHPSPSTNKWWVLACEFLLHLKNTTKGYNMDGKAFDFVFEHLPQIRDLTCLHDQAIDALDANIIKNLEQAILGYNPYKRRHSWKNGTALRYACNDWNTWSDVVVYLEVDAGRLQPSLWVYLCDVNEDLKHQGHKIFGSSDMVDHEESILGLGWYLGKFDQQTIIDAVLGKMQLLMAFEQRTPCKPPLPLPDQGDQ